MTSLNLLVIRAKDPVRLVSLYEVLGLSFKKHRHGKGAEHFACEMSAMVFEIYPSRNANETTAATRLGFSVAAVDETVAKLETMGAKVVSMPAESEWGRRAVVRDFEGHTIELTQVLQDVS